MSVPERAGWPNTWFWLWETLTRQASWTRLLTHMRWDNTGRWDSIFPSSITRPGLSSWWQITFRCRMARWEHLWESSQHFQHTSLRLCLEPGTLRTAPGKHTGLWSTSVLSVQGKGLETLENIPLHLIWGVGIVILHWLWLSKISW